MRIVFVHRRVYPEATGGTYSYIHELGRRLAARGHDVDVITSTRAPDPVRPYELEGMTIHPYAYRRSNPVLSTYRHTTNTGAIFERIAARNSVDVLSIHESQLGHRLAKSPLGRSVCQIPTFHAPVFLEYRYDTAWRVRAEKSPLKQIAHRLTEPLIEHQIRGFERDVLSAADGVVVLSAYSRSHIENHFPSVDLDKVKIIPGGVDVDRFRPVDNKAGVRRALGLAEEPTYLLSVRNLTPRMGLEKLVDAVARIGVGGSANGIDLRLLIVGEGPLRESLERRIRDHGLEGAVSLVGRVANEDLPRFYQAADLFVLPTTAMEGFGIVTVEALSSNLPVVGTPAGATPEILKRIDDRLVTRDTTAEAIGDGISAWLRWRDEDSGTTRYRDEVLSRYTWDAVTEAVEDHYRKTVQAFRARSAERGA